MEVCSSVDAVFDNKTHARIKPLASPGINLFPVSSLFDLITFSKPVRRKNTIFGHDKLDPVGRWSLETVRIKYLLRARVYYFAGRSACYLGCSRVLCIDCDPSNRWRAIAAIGRIIKSRFDPAETRFLDFRLVSTRVFIFPFFPSLSFDFSSILILSLLGIQEKVRSRLHERERELRLILKMKRKARVYYS